MKVFKISLLLLILSVCISCEKDEEPTITLAQNLQDGFWEEAIGDRIYKYDENYSTEYTICRSEDCKNIFTTAPCIVKTTQILYQIREETIVLIAQGTTLLIKIEGDILTINDSFVYQRKAALDYTSCYP